MKRIVCITLVLVLPLLAAACNTISGMGEDLSAGGRAVSNTSEKVKDSL